MQCVAGWCDTGTSAVLWKEGKVVSLVKLISHILWCSLPHDAPVIAEGRRIGWGGPRSLFPRAPAVFATVQYDILLLGQTKDSYI